jgi:hypothetical protein
MKIRFALAFLANCVCRLARVRATRACKWSGRPQGCHQSTLIPSELPRGHGDHLGGGGESREHHQSHVRSGELPSLDQPSIRQTPQMQHLASDGLVRPDLGGRAYIPSYSRRNDAVSFSFRTMPK